MCGGIETRYVGDMSPVKGRKRGRGLIYYKNGDQFEGSFDNDGQKHGNGTCYPSSAFDVRDWFADTVVQSARALFYGEEASVVVRRSRVTKYVGEWSHGQMRGVGRFWFRNGDSYVGQVCAGARLCGVGRMNFANGDIYYGEWSDLDGQRTGNGTILWHSGDRYDGSFRNGKKHGHGVLVKTSGERQVGEWINDCKAGVGLFAIDGFCTGDELKYDGPVRTDTGSIRVKHGRGVLVYKSGDKYEGDFVDGMKHGAGVCQIAEGQRHMTARLRNTVRAIKFFFTGEENMLARHRALRYEGQYENDQMSGSGRFYFRNGDLLVGKFALDRVHGMGTLNYSSGDVFVGEWQMNERCGKGK